MKCIQNFELICHEHKLAVVLSIKVDQFEAKVSPQTRTWTYFIENNIVGLWNDQVAMALLQGPGNLHSLALK